MDEVGNYRKNARAEKLKKRRLVYRNGFELDHPGLVLLQLLWVVLLSFSALLAAAIYVQWNVPPEKLRLLHVTALGALLLTPSVFKVEQ